MEELVEEELVAYVTPVYAIVRVVVVSFATLARRMSLPSKDDGWSLESRPEVADVTPTLARDLESKANQRRATPSQPAAFVLSSVTISSDIYNSKRLRAREVAVETRMITL